MAGLHDLADADTGLVATPEARPRVDRAQPRVRPVAEPKVAVEQPAAPEEAAIVDAAAPAPKKTRAPRKPKAEVVSGEDNSGGDGQEAAE